MIEDFLEWFKELLFGDGDTTLGITPVGGIIMWSGAVADIPNGWQICDGTNDTPDLRNQFIVGAGDTYTPGDTGGSDTVDLEHSHGPGTLATDSDSHNHEVTGGYTTYNGNHTHDISGTSSAGSSHSHSAGTLNADASTATTHLAPSGDAISFRDVDHEHDVSGSTGSESSHTHGAGSYEADAPGSHRHQSSDLTTDYDGHSHDVTSGATAAALTTTEENRPPYYALAFIMRIS